MNRCQAETYCKGFDVKCGEYCIGYVQLQNIYGMSKLPSKYQHFIPISPGPEDRDAFLYLKNFQANVEAELEQGNGIFIYSANKGNGKTTWASKIMNEHFKRVAITNNLRCRGLYVNVPTFMQDLRDNMDNPSETVRETIDAIKECDLVIWDDIGCESPTKWVREQLYIYVNFRDANALSNIYTSNIPLDLLVSDDKLGGRTCDRIRGHAKSIELLGPSRRNFNG